ncbi:LPXTG cell wall anchor domain-containing protein [Sphingomicrobium lutaoense]|uniref:LPXTG-motif cell wall-anchored protein n=1 Tax=Sphingomicrobium lutaoense TaxID=515949 RepID=A0A839Z0W7_9SPHN|nr:LPXTG cell wall anchor domain-containing protein [Sphingomicrobium lutaoense]MBB3763697.1 LPXTG-motif cell wall-anchored protein [Sphingomicrobium lutaoense]
MTKKSDQPEKAKDNGKSMKTVGMAAGIGSAALVAALLYAKRRKKKK